MICFRRDRINGVVLSLIYIFREGYKPMYCSKDNYYFGFWG